MGTPGSMEEILTRFKRWKHIYIKRILLIHGRWLRILNIRKIDSFDSKLYFLERVNFLASSTMFDKRNPITQSLSARYLRFARKNGDPDQPDFPVIMHSPLNQWHSVMDESRSEASIICFRPNSKTSIAFPMIYEHVWWKNDRCVVSWSNRFSRFIYFRLISLTGENSTKEID